MNLVEFLKKQGRLTQRERELIVDAWVEASGVFDESATRAAEHRNEAEASIQEACPADRHTYYKMFLSYPFCPYCRERLLS